MHLRSGRGAGKAGAQVSDKPTDCGGGAAGGGASIAAAERVPSVPVGDLLARYESFEQSFEV